MALWDVGKWDVAVWDIDPPSDARASGGGASRRRRPNEKVVWYDDWVKAQKRDDTPEEEKIEVVEDAIQVVKAYKDNTVPVADAKAAILRAKDAESRLHQVRELEALMRAFFAIKEERARIKGQNDFFVLMMLGIV